MKKKNQHIVTSDAKWAVKGEGNSKATALYDTQAQAIQAARKIAINQKSEVIIHGANSKIRARNSYGNDPFPPRG